MMSAEGRVGPRGEMGGAEPRSCLGRAIPALGSEQIVPLRQEQTCSLHSMEASEAELIEQREEWGK